jgi:hypothetical protein
VDALKVLTKLEAPLLKGVVDELYKEGFLHKERNGALSLAS